MVTSMNKEFYVAYREQLLECEWLAYCCYYMLYDGGLCVNRTSEEIEYTNKFKYKVFLEY